MIQTPPPPQFWASKLSLTYYKMTKLRLVQIEANLVSESNTIVIAYTLYRHLQQYCSHPLNCRRHFKVHLQWKISTIKDRKHCEKGRNYLLQTTSLFLNFFFYSYITLVCQEAVLGG